MASSLEGNKIVAAVLLAGIITVGSGVVSRMIYRPHGLHQNAYRVAGAEAPAAATPVALAAVAPIGERLTAADTGKGAAGAKVCAACHSFDKGGANKVGPGLWEVVDRPIGKHEGFSYSPVIAGKGGAWDYAALDAFIANPKEWAPGTKMSFAGVADPKKRADIIAYLRSLADKPAPLPQASSAPAAPRS